jgi:hypothetical protein
LSRPRESNPRPSLYEFSDLLSTIDSLRSLSLKTPTSPGIGVHVYSPLSSSVASRIASESQSKKKSFVAEILKQVCLDGR